MTEPQAVFDDWVGTWLHLRGLAATNLDGWPLVPVGSVSRETELVCLDPGMDAFRSLCGHIAGDPRAMLTVAAQDVTAYRGIVPAGTRVDRDDETLMSTTFAATSAPAPPAGMMSRWDVQGNRITYCLETDQQIASHGSIAVLAGTATFDAVETTPAFQRRGLGSHVMQTLTAKAMTLGAERGVLAASDEGRRLYLSLGWTPELEMLSLMGV